MGVDAAGPDLPHQIHAHGVTTEREEGPMAQREDAAISPDQVDRRAPAARSRCIFQAMRPLAGTCNGELGGNARLRIGTITATSRIAARTTIPNGPVYDRRKRGSCFHRPSLQGEQAARPLLGE